MSIRRLLAADDPRLRMACDQVGAVDDYVREVVADMAAAMIQLGGVGLAANQVGIMRRICVVWGDKEQAPRVLINPRLTERQGSARHLEGCLSLPGVHVWVQRAARVTVRYSDERGRDRRLRAAGVLARCVQHEVDHLDGRLITDHGEAVAA